MPMNFLLVLASILSLGGAIVSLRCGLTVLFAICIVLLLAALLLIMASKLGFAMFQTETESPFIYIRRRGKVFHLIRGCSALDGAQVLRVPYAYAYRNRMKPCPLCSGIFNTPEPEESEGAETKEEPI